MELSTCLDVAATDTAVVFWRVGVFVAHLAYLELSTCLDVVATLVDKEGSENPFEGRLRGNTFGGSLTDFLDPAHEDDEVSINKRRSLLDEFARPACSFLFEFAL